MTDPKSSDDEKMMEMCVAHVLAAVRAAKIKGLNPYDVGLALFGEGVSLMFEIDIERVSGLLPHLGAYLQEVLASQIIEKARVEGFTDRDLDFLKQRAVDHACELGTAVIRELATTAAARAQLMGGAALPP